MELGIGLGITIFPGWGVMNIGQLFASGEQGAWYDPSDMSSLFQDSAGTTPVTAVEQPVGLMLDKSGRGNHAVQATTTKRPVLSARVNLLTKTDNFADAAWTKSSVTVTGSTVLGPNGVDLVPILNYSGEGLIRQSVGKSTDAINYKSSCWLYSPTSNALTTRLVGDGAVIAGSTTKITVAAGAWTKFESWGTAGAGTTFIRFDVLAPSGSDISAWHPSLTLATDAHLPYQRVNTATDYDAPAKYPAYTQVDGTDDALTSATGGGGTTGFFFSSAVLTTLAGAKQVLWSDAGTNTGYEVSINAANKLQLSVGTGATRVTVESAALSTNARYVLTAWHDGTNIYVRVNTGTPVSVACGVASAGTAEVTQFCENGASAGYFRGRSYGVVYRKDAAPGPATIDAVIRYLATKSGGPV